MEVAASLRARGIWRSTSWRPETVPFARTLGPEVGAVLQGRARGARRRLPPRATGSRPSRTTRVTLTERRPRSPPSWSCWASACGRPSGWREAAGLTVDRGVVVDDRLRTSAPGVFAAGDIARFPYGPTGEQVRIEHWAVAQTDGPGRGAEHPGRRHGRFRRRRSSGPRNTTSRVATSVTPSAGTESTSPAICRRATRRVAYRSQGRTLAVATMGRDSVSLEAEAAFERDDQATLAAFGVSR